MVLTTMWAAGFVEQALQIVLSMLQVFSGDFLYLAVGFFVLAIIAGLIGAQGVAGISMEIARIFIILFVILAIVALVL